MQEHASQDGLVSATDVVEASMPLPLLSRAHQVFRLPNISCVYALA